MWHRRKFLDFFLGVFYIQTGLAPPPVLREKKRFHERESALLIWIPSSLQLTLSDIV
jgi:hypothetical protein